jgi:RNA polymerase sigma-70 factor (ECF subfamily)
VGYGVTISFDDVLNKNRDRVFNLLFRLTGDYHTSEDLFQETFLKVYRGLDNFDGKSRVSTWVYAIALNVFRDHARKRRWGLLPSGRADSNNQETKEDETFSPEDDLIRKEERTLLQQTLNGLRTTLKVPTVLYYIDGYSIRDIMEVTGRTQTDIRVSLHRARRIIKTKWEALQ